MDERRASSFQKIFPNRGSRILLGISVACGVGMLALAIALGSAYSSVTLLTSLNRDTLTYNDQLTKTIMDNIDEQALEENLMFLSQKPHPTGFPDLRVYLYLSHLD